ncbi:MAG: hypothetical protein LBP87_14570, partial [Planctomycetaceae bacterium]|nr:hypothetical protein [Planctomycetaceae bacterium]
SETKDFTITVIGTNKPPVAKTIPYYELTPKSQPLVISINDIAEDINEDDDLNFYSIGDWILNDINENGIFTYKGAITIQFNKKQKNITISILDETIWSLLDSIDLKIIVADDSGNMSNYRSADIIVPIKLSKEPA